MSKPSQSDVHVNAPLTNISIAFIQAAKDFVADKVFPMVPVSKQSDRYFTYKKGDWFRSEAQKRADCSESAGSGFEIDNTASYFSDCFSVHKDIGDQLRANQDQPINMDRDATTWVAQQMLLKREKEFVATSFQPTTWTGGTGGVDITPGTLWDAVGSDPISDIETQMDSVHSKSGYRPNVFVATPAVHRALKNNEAILDRIKYTQTGVFTEQLLASILGVQNYMVARAVENSAAEGAADSLDYLYGNDALLAYAAPAPSILQPSAGYQFTWTGLNGGGSGTRISKFRMDSKKCDRVEGDMCFDHKIIAPELGVFFLNPVA